MDKLLTLLGLTGLAAAGYYWYAENMNDPNETAQNTQKENTQSPPPVSTKTSSMPGPTTIIKPTKVESGSVSGGGGTGESSRNTLQTMPEIMPMLK